MICIRHYSAAAFLFHVIHVYLRFYIFRYVFVDGKEFNLCVLTVEGRYYSEKL